MRVNIIIGSTRKTLVVLHYNSPCLGGHKPLWGRVPSAGKRPYFSCINDHVITFEEIHRFLVAVIVSGSSSEEWYDLQST